MLRDKAAWYRSHAPKVPENIRLVQQPAYSPQLMLVEHIWEDIRENHFYNHVYKSMEGVESALCTGLLELCSEPERLRSLTFFPHLRLLHQNAIWYEYETANSVYFRFTYHNLPSYSS